MIPQHYRETLCLLRVSIIHPSYFQQKHSLLGHCGCEHVNKHRRLNLLALRVQLGGLISRSGNQRHLKRYGRVGGGNVGEMFVVIMRHRMIYRHAEQAHWLKFSAPEYLLCLSESSLSSGWSESGTLNQVINMFAASWRSKLKSMKGQG